MKIGSALYRLYREDFDTAKCKKYWLKWFGTCVVIVFFEENVDYIFALFSVLLMYVNRSCSLCNSLAVLCQFGAELPHVVAELHHEPVSFTELLKLCL